MTPVDPGGRSFGVLTDDTSRSGIPAGQFAKQEILMVGTPTGGSYTLSYGSGAEVDTLTPNETFTAGTLTFSFTLDGITYTTGAVPFNATNAVLQAMLNAAKGPNGQSLIPGAITVSAGPIASAATKFTYLASLGPVTGLTVTNTATTPVTAKLTVVRTTSGTVETTAAIAATATAAEVATALKALTAIGASGVSVAGAAGGPYTVTFASTLTGPQPLLVATSSLTGAGEPKPVVAQLQPGVTGTALTTTGNGTAFSVSDIAEIEAEANVSVITGSASPTVVLSLECSDDGTNWFKVGSAMPGITAINTPVKETFDVAAYQQARWAWTVTGTTPSLTTRITTLVKLTGNA